MESIAQLNDIVIERGFDRKKLIKWIISTMMMFIPMLMQVNENYTTDIRIFFMITILVIMIWAFELMPLAAPALVLPIVYISCGLATPVQAFSPWTIVDGINLISYSIARNLNIHLSWVEYMKEMGIMTFLLSAVYIIAILFFYKGNAGIFKKENHFKTKEYFDKEHSKLGKMTISEKKVIFVLAIMVAILCTSSIHKISAGWVFAIGAFCFYLPGINVAEDKDLKSINMPMIILMTGAMTIGAVSMATGTEVFIGKILTGYLTGSSFTIVSISWLIGVVVNFLITPLAAASALTQPEAAIQNGISPTVILNSYAVGLEQIIFPYEYVLPLMMFSYGVMSLKEFIKIYLLKMVLSIVFLLIICVPYWELLELL